MKIIQMYKQYEGADYFLPKDENKFKKAMLDTKDGNLKELKKYKDNVNNKIEWYGGKFCPEQSLLSVASQNNHIGIVKYLIDKKAKIEDQDEYGSTPLHYAALKGNLDIVKLLLENGANVNMKASKKFVRIYGIETQKITGTHETPLHNACRLGHLDVVKYLISKGASLDAVDYYGRTPLNMCEKVEDYEQTSGEKEIEDYIKNYTSS